MVAARPDVFNHNLETVPRLYPTIRPGARYFTSLRLLSRVKEIDPAMFTKSGLMVGLGETREEILQVMDDLRAADVDFLTVGQYLQPTPKHAPIDRFWTPAEFDELASLARAKGFLMVSASPLTRSSYHAGDDFARLRAARPRKRRADRGVVTRHAERRVVRFAPRQLFDLVADVARYPEFLPWCPAARVRRQGLVETDELVIGFGPFHEKFVSRVVLTPDARWRPRIETTGVEGPFRHLASRWWFEPHPDGTLIDFSLEFEFRSILLQQTVRLLFAEAVKRMVSAFEARANQLYGKPSARPATPASSTR